MGNRAVICFDEYNDDAIGVYLHWNGGRDSVEGFLEATRRVMASRGEDAQYARARLVEVICIFFGGNTSVGLDKCRNLDCDNYENGVYVIDSNKLEIIGREFKRHDREQQEYDANEMADEILIKIRLAERI